MRELNILQFEWKAFKNYLGEKNARKIGFFLLMGLWGLFVFGLAYSIPFLKSFASSILINITASLAMGVPFIFIFAFFVGTSLVSSVRTGMDKQLRMLFQAPINPKIALFLKLGLNALGLSTIFLLIFLPMTVWGMLLIGAPLLLILLQVFLLLLGLVVFSFLGEFVGLFLLRYGRTGKILFGIVIVLFGGIGYYLYFMITGGQFSVIQQLSPLIHPFSPLRWFVVPLLIVIGQQSIPHAIFPTLSVCGVSFFLLYGITSRTTSSLLTGSFQPVKEKKQITTKKWEQKGISLPFELQSANLFQKDFSLIKREPDLLISALALVMVGAIYYSVMGYQFSPLTLLLVTFFFVAMIPMGMISTLFGVENRSLLHLLSSPVPPSKIVEGKALASLLIQVIFSIILIILSYSFYAYTTWELAWISLTLLSLSFGSTGIASPLIVKFVDFEVDNPRQTLHGIGGLAVMGGIALLLLPHIVLTAFTFFGSRIAMVGGLINIFLSPFLLWKYGMSFAGKILSERKIPL